MNNIGDFLVKLRKEKGISQKELADYLNVSDKAVSKWERDICLPDNNNLKLIADYYDISVEELLSAEKIKVNNEKYKHLCFLFGFFILVLLIIVLTFVYINKNNSNIRVYEVYSEQLSLDGNFITSDRHEIMNISGISIHNCELCNGYAFYYEIYINNQKIYTHGNDLESFEKEEYPDLKNINDYFVEEGSLPGYNRDLLELPKKIDNVELKIKYIDEKYIEREMYFVLNIREIR